MPSYRIKDWSQFQHFKDRTPPWIKLYRDILDDPDWHELGGDVAKTLVMLWLVASEDKEHAGQLPELRKLAFRLRMPEHELSGHIETLTGHWLESSDITAISPRYHGDTPEERRGEESRGETEGERETEGETRKRKTLPPANWQPCEKTREWFHTQGFDFSLESMTAEYVDGCQAKGRKYVDHDAAFRNWSKNKHEFRRRDSKARTESAAGRFARRLGL